MFIDLEKAYDSILRKVEAFCNKGVFEGYVVVREMYKGAETRVKSNLRLTGNYRMRVKVHQRSVLSFLLYIK